MKEIGILFQDDMALAAYEGRKTLTSRLRGLEKINECSGEWDLCESNGGDAPDVFLFWNGYTHDYARIKSPYGQPGDILIGREAFRLWDYSLTQILVEYRAGGEDFLYDVPWGEGKPIGLRRKRNDGLKPWRSSLIMPWKFSRLRLEVVKVWPSRLQDMTEEMAIQEGAPDGGGYDLATGGHYTSYLDGYRWLWDRINAKKGHPWSKNDWVFRIEFRLNQNKTYV